MGNHVWYWDWMKSNDACRKRVFTWSPLPKDYILAWLVYRSCLWWAFSMPLMIITVYYLPAKVKSINCNIFILLFAFYEIYWGFWYCVDRLLILCGPKSQELCIHTPSVTKTKLELVWREGPPLTHLYLLVYISSHATSSAAPRLWSWHFEPAEGEGVGTGLINVKATTGGPWSSS